MAAEKISYRDEIAREIIARIEAGTTPWQKPWKPGIVGMAPFNPSTDKPYRGINDLALTMRGYSDPRWMTYNQATANGSQVRRGEKAATIEYWQWSERAPRIDNAGRPILDEKGKPDYYEARLERPRVFYAKVFNAEQIDGLAPWTPPSPSFDPMERAEAIIRGSGVPVLHDQRDSAFYLPGKDRIHLPARAAFHGASSYYETVLHELGHATGHENRLNRFFGSHGSEGYAKEELRAEIASFMLARELGVGFDPSNHAAYVEGWLKALREDRNEIFRAARDAETIKSWVMEPERRPELEKSAQGSAKAAEKSEGPDMADAANMTKRSYLVVPFAEKNEAKVIGAKWDRKAKSWYAPEGVDPELFAKWQAPGPSVPEQTVSPEIEFGDFLKEHGLLLDRAPIMDGEWRRVPVEGDSKGQASGSYRGFLDGRATGQATNYKSGEIAVKWIATGLALTDRDREKIKTEAAQVRQARQAERLSRAEAAAKVAYGIWTHLQDRPTPENCPYLERKGVSAHGVKMDEEGRLAIPQRDSDGRLWGVQFCNEDGKRYLKDSLKIGTMHAIEASGEGTLAAASQAAKTLIIAEGYATAATIYEATAMPVIVAFDAGNLKAVALAIHAARPDIGLVIAADNDHANAHGNVGLIKAGEAAKAVGGRVVVPGFSQEEKARGLTDFNDLAAVRGKLAVRQSFDAVLERNRKPAELALGLM